MDDSSSSLHCLEGEGAYGVSKDSDVFACHGVSEAIFEEGVVAHVGYVVAVRQLHLLE